MKRSIFWLLISISLINMPISRAHEPSATYVANESVLVTNGTTKVLFDPFFHKGFGIYQLVPENTLKKIFANEAPFNDLSAIVISHAHADHFSADDMLKYLSLYPSTQLIAPKQAVDELMALDNPQNVSEQVHSVQLAFNDPPKQIEVDDLIVEGVRIPHAGWPGRADIENIVFRVTLNHSNKQAITVMHMGDADADDDHYLPYKSHWQKRKSHMAFPPYWFLAYMEGNYILDELINSEQHVGVHVPVEVPKSLIKTGKDFFSKPGEQRAIMPEHKHQEN